MSKIMAMPKCSYHFLEVYYLTCARTLEYDHFFADCIAMARIAFDFCCCCCCAKPRHGCEKSKRCTMSKADGGNDSQVKKEAGD